MVILGGNREQINTNKTPRPLSSGWQLRRKLDHFFESGTSNPALKRKSNTSEHATTLRRTFQLYMTGKKFKRFRRVHPRNIDHGRHLKLGMLSSIFYYVCVECPRLVSLVV